MTTPKAISALAEARPPPPLLVASMSIKTTLDPKVMLLPSYAICMNYNILSAITVTTTALLLLLLTAERAGVAQTCANEIVAASVVYLTGLPADRPCPKSEWNKPPQLRHFSVVRKLGRQEPFPAGMLSWILNFRGAQPQASI